MASWIHELLGKEADGLLDHRCQTIAKEQLHLPGPDFIDRITGRKAFERPMMDGIELLHKVQDIYLDKEVTIA